MAESSHTSLATSIDVFDNFVDAKGSPIETVDDAAEFCDLLANFYRDAPLPVSAGHDIRFIIPMDSFTGILVVPAASIRLDDRTLNRMDAFYDGDGPIALRWRRAYTAAFLYGDAVVEADPFTFAPFLLEREGGVFAAPHLNQTRQSLQNLRPLIEHQLLILAPLPSAREREQDQAVYARLLKEDCYFAMTSFTSVQRALRTAVKYNASLLPGEPDTWELIQRATSHYGAGVRLTEDIRVALGLAEVTLPIFAGVDPSVLVRIHNEEDAFVEWRAQLRNAERLVSRITDADGLEREARGVFEDLLVPQAAAVRRAVSRSAALRRAVYDQPIQGVLGAAFASGAAAAAGLPIEGVLLSSIAGGLARLVGTAAHPPRPQGAASVIAHLIAGTRRRT